MDVQGAGFEPRHCKNKQAKHTETYMENQFNQLFSTVIHLIQFKKKSQIVKWKFSVKLPMEFAWYFIISLNGPKA